MEYAADVDAARSRARLVSLAIVVMFVWEERLMDEDSL